MHSIPTLPETIVELMTAGDAERLKRLAQQHPPTRRELAEVKKSRGWLPHITEPVHSKLGDWMH